MKTYEVKIFRKRGECETIRGLTSTQMFALAETFSHYGVSYKRFAYDGEGHLESVDWVEAPDLLAALECGAGDQDGPIFLEFVAMQLEDREMLDATARALRRKARKERAALAGARGAEGAA